MTRSKATRDAISLLLSARVVCADNEPIWKLLNNAAIHLGAEGEPTVGPSVGVRLVAIADEYTSHFEVAKRYGYPTLW